MNDNRTVGLPDSAVFCYHVGHGWSIHFSTSPPLSHLVFMYFTDIQEKGLFMKERENNLLKTSRLFFAAVNISSIIFVFMHVLVLNNFVLAQDTLKDKFLQEAPKQWLEYRKLACHLEGNGSVTNNHPASKSKYMQYQFAIDGENARFVSIENTNRTCTCRNQLYRFTASKEGEKTWGLTSFTTSKYKHISPDLIGEVQFPVGKYMDPVINFGAYGSVMTYACRGMVLWTTWLPRMIESREFKLLNVSNDGNEGLIKVEFDYRPDPNGNNDYIRSGMVVLDPKRFWLIHHANVKGKWYGDQRGTIHITNIYDDKMMPFPVVKRQTRHDFATDGKEQVECDTIFDCEYRIPTKDNKQYTLSSFGIPEPSKETVENKEKEEEQSIGESFSPR